jgi:hypothetical protein
MNLSFYIEAAILGASYKQLENTTYYAEIPGFQGLFVHADKRDKCTLLLRKALKGWIVLGLQLGHPLPVISGVNLIPLAKLIRELKLRDMDGPYLVDNQLYMVKGQIKLLIPDIEFTEFSEFLISQIISIAEGREPDSMIDKEVNELDQGSLADVISFFKAYVPDYEVKDKVVTNLTTNVLTRYRQIQQDIEKQTESAISNSMKIYRELIDYVKECLNISGFNSKESEELIKIAKANLDKCIYIKNQPVPEEKKKRWIKRFLLEERQQQKEEEDLQKKLQIVKKNKR